MRVVYTSHVAEIGAHPRWRGDDRPHRRRREARSAAGTPAVTQLNARVAAAFGLGGAVAVRQVTVRAVGCARGRVGMGGGDVGREPLRVRRGRWGPGVSGAAGAAARPVSRAPPARVL